jgi:hypothetical protein
MSFGQILNYGYLPWSFKYHIWLGVFVSLAMMGTSASFRYEALPLEGRSMAVIPAAEKICNQSLITNITGYFCSGGLNSNTTSTSWTYLQDVYTGGQGSVTRYGQLGKDKKLGANVTLSIIPPGWVLGNDNSLPWMAMSVTCVSQSISAVYNGSGLTAQADIIVNNKPLDILDIANMPEWGSVVHLYQQVNDSGPASSLSPWIVVMLSRNLGDNTANFKGVALDTVTSLGAAWLDLHGYGPVVQNLLGAAALCEFDGSTGGMWPNLLWPSLNSSNTVIGTVFNDRPTIATTLLNYGPSWQYNPVSENSLPGGSVSYIANNTGSDVSFADLFAAYIRNQWTLMAYSLPRQTSYQTAQEFFGSGPSQLYITLTSVSILPTTALLTGLIVTIRALIYTVIKRHWVNRVEFASWWLFKALCPEMYKLGYSNATERDFYTASKGFYVVYGDKRPDDVVGHLVLRSQNQGATGVVVGIPINRRRDYR